MRRGAGAVLAMLQAGYGLRQAAELVRQMPLRHAALKAQAADDAAIGLTWVCISLDAFHFLFSLPLPC